MKWKEWKELLWREGHLCLNTKASPSSTGAGRIERLMHDNENTSSGTFTKWYSAHLRSPPGLHHVRSQFSHLLCIPAPVLLGWLFFFFLQIWCSQVQTLKTHSSFQETAQDEGSTCRSACDSWFFLFPQQTLTTKEGFPLHPTFSWEWCHCVMAISILTVPRQDPILSPLFCQRKKGIECHTRSCSRFPSSLRVITDL